MRGEGKELVRIYGFTVKYWGMGVRLGMLGRAFWKGWQTVGRGWDERPKGIGPAVKLLKRRLDGKRLFCFILLLVCSFSCLATSSIVKIINQSG